jgi:hypothetical protein
MQEFCPFYFKINVIQTEGTSFVWETSPEGAVLFYAPLIKDRGAYCFVLSVILSFVILSETLTLPITFEWYLLGL